MRLFVALDIDADIRERVTAFRNRMRGFAPDIRWINAETFHVTLQFLGETTKPDEILDALRSVHAGPITLAFRGAGFFPSPKAPRVFWIGIDADDQLQSLVTTIAQALEPLGFVRESGRFTPHLTLARAGSGKPKPVRGEMAAPSLQRIRGELAKSPQPDFGTMTTHQFFLYESHLSPAGPRYEKRASFPLQ